MIFLAFLAVIAYVVYFFFFKDCYVILRATGEKQSEIMKLIREADPYMGLRSAQEIVDSVPYMIEFSKMSYTKAKKLVEAINKNGGVAELYVHFFWKGKVPVGRQQTKK